MTREPVRIANCSGFYGDRRGAATEVLSGGPIDVLCGDWLAELTMLILAKARSRGRSGWATTFIRDLEPVLAQVAQGGIRVVSNAGGLDPAGCAQEVRDLVARLGVDLSVGYVDGDDLLPGWEDLVASGWDATNLDTGEPFGAAGAAAVSANAYLGGWGITEALRAGADIVITGRVTDAAVTTGAAAWWHGWAPTDLDPLAGAVAAGHIIECGAQATGGNYAFFDEIDDPTRPGMPIAEIAADGSSTITKHPGTGGTVTVGTVTAQLLYEVSGPHYLGPDVTIDLRTIKLEQAGPDRVLVSGCTGSLPPPTLKVSVNADGGFRNSMTFMITGLDAEAKAAAAEAGLWDAIPGGAEGFDHVDRTWWPAGRTDPTSNIDAVSTLRVTVHGADERAVGRSFADAAIGLALSSYPGCFYGSPPGPAQAIGLYWPTTVERAQVTHAVTLPDGRRVVVPDPATAAALPDDDEPGATVMPDGPMVTAPLGRVVGARSGDKGGNANLGVWARTDESFGWLDGFLTTGRLRGLVPDVCDGREVRRYRLPNLRSLNFVIVGLLGRGVAGCDRLDPQAKGLGEYLRAKLVAIPEELL